MPRYLVVAHQTATEPHLVERVRTLARDPETTLTLLVPATRVEHLLTWERGESELVARERGDEARRLFEAAGARVVDTLVGDESPILAIEDELRARPDSYDAIVLSTLPPGRSRWLDLDTHAQAERRLAMPIIHVYEGADASWPARSSAIRGRGDGPVVGLLRWLTASDEGEASGWRGRLRARGLGPIIAFMALYLVGSTILALTVDRTFFLGEAFALALFAALIAGLLVVQRRAEG